MTAIVCTLAACATVIALGAMAWSAWSSWLDHLAAEREEAAWSDCVAQVGRLEARLDAQAARVEDVSAKADEAVTGLALRRSR